MERMAVKEMERLILEHGTAFVPERRFPSLAAAAGDREVAIMVDHETGAVEVVAWDSETTFEVVGRVYPR